MTRLLWLFHNAIAHPLCGLLWFFGADDTAQRLHDWTVPR